MKPTPLQLLARLCGGPDTTDWQAVTAWLLATGLDPVRSPREQAVIRYLLAASQGGQFPPGQTGRGSLKHLLWWLRDHAGSLYEPAATAVLKSALESDWSLATAADHLTDHPLVGGFAQQALQAERAVDLVRYLTFEDLTAGRVAWNRTTLNLAKVAFRAGAQWYAAVSTEGGCLMAARDSGLTIQDFPLVAGWTQPFPNLVLLTRAGTLEDEARMRGWLQNS